MPADGGWGPPPPERPLPLGTREVDVWRVPLDLPADVLGRCVAVLSAPERARAARFRFPLHRDRFVAGRGAQREILARYLDADPASLRYRESAHGKLSLDVEGEASAVRFNVSNAGGLALVAVARGRELGVDLEEVRPMPDGADIARRFFSAPENDVFSAQRPEDRDVAFFRCWTRKEAFVKAVGEGLSMPLDRFDVAFAPGEEARLLCTRPDPAQAARWTMCGLEPGAGYVGALCADGGDYALRRFAWSASAARF